MLRFWREDARLICEVRDAGWFDNPLADRELPPAYAAGGRGLWTANQVCDLAQIRSFPEGTIVRLNLTRH